MSKAPINFESIDSKSLAYLNAFVTARIAIAKEDIRHMAEMKPLKAKLDVIHENREIDLKMGMHTTKKEGMTYDEVMEVFKLTCCAR